MLIPQTIFIKIILYQYAGMNASVENLLTFWENLLTFFVAQLEKGLPLNLWSQKCF